jgi:predicted RNA binding protein YcfA (HicA-like mRNA interferase family)
MSRWPSAKARDVLRALERIGWTLKRQSGSHKTLAREGFPDFVFAFHDRDEIGPKMLARISKHTGLTPEDLQTVSPNKQLQRTVTRRRWRAARASFHCAHASRWTEPER